MGEEVGSLMQIGQKYLISTDNWFFGPDGENYKAVFGTVHQVVDSEVALGMKTNRNSTNWYVAIGDAIIAGCQIHYAMRADNYNERPVIAEIDHEGKRHPSSNLSSRIYNADRSGLKAFAG